MPHEVQRDIAAVNQDVTGGAEGAAQTLKIGLVIAQVFGGQRQRAELHLPAGAVREQMDGLEVLLALKGLGELGQAVGAGFKPDDGPFRWHVGQQEIGLRDRCVHHDHLTRRVGAQGKCRLGRRRRNCHRFQGFINSAGGGFRGHRGRADRMPLHFGVGEGFGGFGQGSAIEQHARLQRRDQWGRAFAIFGHDRAPDESRGPAHDRAIRRLKSRNVYFCQVGGLKPKTTQETNNSFLILKFCYWHLHQSDGATQGVPHTPQGPNGIVRGTAGTELFAQGTDAHFEVGGDQPLVVWIDQLHGLPAFELLPGCTDESGQEHAFAMSDRHFSRRPLEAEGLAVELEQQQGRGLGGPEPHPQVLNAGQQLGLFNRLDQVIVGP